MGYVTVDREFFVKERNGYSDWPFAFWREFFQNSVDAGSTHIDIQVNNNRIDFVDNGIGMSRETLEDVYMRLGKTTKDGVNTTGGHGRARIITCFSHNNYTIRSKDWICLGDGGDYEVESGQDWVKGCQVTVNVDTKGRFGDINMVEALERYLACSQLPCRITSNLESIDGWNDWLYKRRLVKRLSFGNVHVNKSGEEGNMYVRVRGACMFRVYVPDSPQVVLEIDPDISLQVLLSNRDSMHDKYQQELNSFIQKIAIDKVSALDSRRERRETFGRGHKIAARKNLKIKADKPWYKPNVQGTLAKEDIFKMLEGGDKVAALTAFIGDSDNEYWGNEGLDEFTRGMIIDVDTTNDDVLKVIRHYNPKNWGKEDGYNVGGTRKKLLKMWAIACDWALSVWLEMNDVDGIEWVPGFHFSDKNTLAVHCSNNGVHGLLLNPVNNEGKMNWKLRNKADRAMLLSIAAHEVTHVQHEYHDEKFASANTLLVGHLNAFQREIFREMDGILGRA